MHHDPQNTIRISRNSGQYVQRENWIGIRWQGPYVVLLIDNKTIPITTVQAHAVGWQMLREADDCIREANNGVLWNGHRARQSVILTVNGQSLNISPAKARKIAAALLRKADYADDFQLDTKSRMVK